MVGTILTMVKIKDVCLAECEPDLRSWKAIIMVDASLACILSVDALNALLCQREGSQNWGT